MFPKHRQGKALGSQVRQVINNFRLCFTKAKEDKLRQGDEDAGRIIVIRETSLATGVSEWVVKMAKNSSHERGCESPNNKRPNRSGTQRLDDFEKCALRRPVHTSHVC